MKRDARVTKKASLKKTQGGPRDAIFKESLMFLRAKRCEELIVGQ
jgi:hypothetical protein